MDGYLDNYKHKVMRIEELSNTLKSSHSGKTTILCHGVFDVVHPGHLRHLAFAKSKADLLIVSVTSDSHIKKGAYRPHVPENMRALNLAALEMVDFVIVDSNEKPIENINYLKPNFFAKGFEYSNSNLNPATDEEDLAISKYGGKMIFTPGDFVLSSSKLIDESAPNIQIEKLLAVMDTQNLEFSDLITALEEIQNLTVHVVGDTIVDIHLETSLLGGQTKTPTLSVKHLEEQPYTGGAAVVAKHLSAAGAKVTLSTMLGEDLNSKFVLNDLKSWGVNVNVLTEEKRPTTEKKVIVCNGYRLLKIDIVENAPCTEQTIQEFASLIANTSSEILIFSDFRHGIFHKKSINKFMKSIPVSCLTVADSQVASRWGNICDFIGFDLITPNEKEARFSVSDQDSTIGPLANKIYETSKCKNLILKLGSRGAIALMESEMNKGPRMISLDALTHKAIDPVGAGDALIAYASLILKNSNSLPLALIVGSIAAACESEIDGNVPITIDKVRSKIEFLMQQSEYKIG